ncbi:MFS transporter [Legionella sp. km772]|uniref:MFS transporter n=1 Tax=Legionella sp. km772 TaxID=2498111 RepID=UPI000F8D82A2|nr:MFS transporter [Legionella sp. km772]RUR12757.1 MFS transporter [Legionella sp. km772]
MLALSTIWLLNYLALASFSAVIVTPSLPAIEQFYSLSQGQVEWLVSIFLLGYVIGQLLYGPLANRFGRLFALRFGLVINLVGILICFTALDGNYYLLLLGRLVTALGSASGLACTFMLINEWLPEAERKRALASSILFFTLGIGLAVVLGGIMTEYYDWSYCFIILLLHGVVMILGTLTFKETLIRRQALNIRTIIHNYQQVLACKELVIYSLVVGLCSAISYCFSAAGPSITKQFFNLSPLSYGYWNGLNMIGMLIGGLIAKYLLQHYKAQQLVMWGLVGTAMGLVSLAMLFYSSEGSVLWFFLSVMSLYLFSGFLFSGGSYLALISIQDKASGSAMMSFLNMLTAVLAVIFLGYLSTNSFLAFLLVLGGLWFLTLILSMFFTSSQILEHSNPCP